MTLSTLSISEELLTRNFHEGRSGPYPISAIVIHVTEGNAASVRSWFRNPAADVSAHYMITKTGQIVRFVREENTAWHAGRVDHPTAPLVLERRDANPNAWTIGIEHEGDGTHELTAPQRAASIALIRDIAARRAIPIDRRHIIGHHEIYAPKTCPGAISVDRLVNDARDAVASDAGATSRPMKPLVVWSGYLGDWLIVTRVASDTDWSFVRLGSLRATTRAESPLSEMPSEPR